jgi:hypothetical protein
MAGAVEHDKTVGRCVWVLASHLRKSPLAGFHEFVQVLNGRILDFGG